MHFYAFLAKKGLKWQFSNNVTSDEIGRDMPQKSDIPAPVYPTL